MKVLLSLVQRPSICLITFRSSVLNSKMSSKLLKEVVSPPVRVYRMSEFGPEIAVNPVASREVTRTGSSKFKVTMPAVRSAENESILGPL